MGVKHMKGFPFKMQCKYCKVTENKLAVKKDKDLAVCVVKNVYDIFFFVN